MDRAAPRRPPAQLPSSSVGALRARRRQSRSRSRSRSRARAVRVARVPGVGAPAAAASPPLAVLAALLRRAAEPGADPAIGGPGPRRVAAGAAARGHAPAGPLAALPDLRPHRGPEDAPAALREVHRRR